MYIDVINRKVRLHLKDKTLEIQNTFSQCASILTEDSRFSNCCKGFIVNFDYVNTISGNDFLMQNGDYVPIKILFFVWLVYADSVSPIEIYFIFGSEV